MKLVLGFAGKGLFLILIRNKGRLGMKSVTINWEDFIIQFLSLLKINFTAKFEVDFHKQALGNKKILQIHSKRLLFAN